VRGPLQLSRVSAPRSLPARLPTWCGLFVPPSVRPIVYPVQQISHFPPPMHQPPPTAHSPSAGCQVQPVCMCACAIVCVRVCVRECPALTKGYHKVKHVHVYVFTAIFLFSPPEPALRFPFL